MVAIQQIRWRQRALKPALQSTKAYRNVYKRFRRKAYGNIRKGNNSMYFFTRWTEYDNITIDDTPNKQGAFQFKLSDLPDYTEFVSLFDLYRIRKVVLKIIPQFNTNQLSAASVSGPAGSILGINQIHTAIDYDNTAFTDKLDLMQYQTYKLTHQNHTCTRVLYPKIKVSTDSTDSFHVDLSQKLLWLNCQDPGYAMGNILYSIDSPFAVTPSAGVQLTYQVYAKFFLEFKNTL